MNSWLIGLSETRKTDEDLLQESIENLPTSELRKLAFDLDPLSLPTEIDDMRIKIGQAVRQGQELAREQPELEKISFLPALAAGAARLAPIAGRVLGGGGAKSIVGGIAKDMAISGAASKVMGALKPAAPAASAAGEIAGGFKYAFSAGGMLQQAAGYVAKNPGTALTAAGAVGGAMMAPRDSQTGQKQYLRGALAGGGIAAGANAISGGGIANRMRSSVMNRESPLMGQSVRKYMMDAAASSKGKSPIPAAAGSRTGQSTYGRVAPAAPAASTQASAPSAPPAATSTSYVGGPVMRGPSAVTPMHTGGPVAGAVKVAQDRFSTMTPVEQLLYVAQLDAIEKRANRQTLTYDPATKTFTRQHLDPSTGGEALTAMGANPIQAGTKEMVRNSEGGMHHFGTPEYVNARVSQTERRFPTPVGNPATTQNTAAFRAAPRAMGTPPRIPGAVGGVSGIASAAAKPVAGAVTTMGKALARR